MTDTERTLRCLPLDRLVPSPENVRKTPAEDAAFAELKASIAAHGLLENLLVRAAEPDRRWRPPLRGRRRRAPPRRTPGPRR